MRFLAHTGLLAGILLLVGLLLWQGVVDVWSLLATSGWILLCLPLLWLPSFLPAAEGWRSLFPADQQPRFLHALLAIWMGRAVNNLLPVATIGGEVVKARLLYLWGTRGTEAAASVIVDKTAQVVAVILWGLSGAGILLLLSADDELALVALGGFVVLTACVTGFVLVQRAGMFEFLAHWGEKLLKPDSFGGLRLGAREIDSCVVGIYTRKSRFIRSVLLKTLALVWQTLEVWAACLLLGHPVGAIEALMLKSLTITLSDVAFVIPNAYGVQEGAFILIGGLVGMTPDTALAVSLALRIKDILLDPAGLLALHRIETRNWQAKTPA